MKNAFVSIMLTTCCFFQCSGNPSVMDKVDKTAPTVAFTNLSPNQIITTDMIITGTASDDNGIAAVRVCIDDIVYDAIGSNSWNDWKYYLSIAGLSRGNHTLKAVVRDIEGNESSVEVTVFCGDNENPTIAFSNLTQNQVVRTNIWVKGTAADNKSVAGVCISINNYLFDAVGTNGWNDWEFYLDISKLSVGYNTIKAIAVDATGNSTTESVTIFCGDQSVPQVQFANLTDNQVIKNSLWIAGTASDDVGVASVQISVDDFVYSTIGNADFSQWKYFLDISNLAIGTHAIKAIVTDRAGNINTKTVTIQCGESNPPTAVFSNLVNSQVLKQSLWINGTATDDTSISAVKISVDGYVHTAEGSADWAQWRYYLDVSNLSTGTHSISVIAIDKFGNQGSSTVSIVCGDSSNPTVTIGNLSGGQQVNANMWITGTASDDTNVTAVQVSIDGYLYDAVGTAGFAQWKYFLDITRLTPGNHTIIATAKDAAGNSASVSVTVYCNPPASSVYYVTSNTSVDSQKPRMAVDYGGGVHIVYQSKEANALYWNIVYRSNLDFSVPTNLTTLGSGHCTDADVTVDANYIRHVVYQSKEYTTACYNIAYRNSVNWGSRVDITQNTAVDALRPRVAVDANGRVYVAYYSKEYNASYWNVALRCSDNWGALITITTNTDRHAKNPTIAVSSAGVAHIAYQSQEYDGIYYTIAYRKSSNWASRVDITTSSCDCLNPSIVLDIAGNPQVAYQSYEYSGNCLNICYRKSTDGWSPVYSTQNTASALDSVDAALCVDAAGKAVIAYSSKEYSADYYTIASKNSDDWDLRVDMSRDTANNADSPGVLVDRNGRMHVCYCSGEFASGWSNVVYRYFN